MKHLPRQDLTYLTIISFLLVACQQNTQQWQQAAKNTVAGPYFYTRSTSLCLVSRVTAGANNTTQSTRALVPSTRETWIGPNGAGRIRQASTGAPTFFSEQERQHWIAQGSPPFEERFDRQVSGGLVALDVQTLPRTTIMLPNALRAETHKMNRTGDGGMAETIRDMLAEQVASDDLRRALYNVVSQLPHASIQPNSTDSIGRSGTAIRVPDTVNGAPVERVLLFDPQTYELLETDEVLVTSAPWLQIQQATSFCRTTYQVRGTVSTTLVAR